MCRSQRMSQSQPHHDTLVVQHGVHGQLVAGDSANERRMGAGFAAHVQLQVGHVVVEVQQLVVGEVERAHVMVELQQLVAGEVGRAHVVVEVQQLVVGEVRQEGMLLQLEVV